MSRITTSAAAALVVLLFVPGIALPQAAGPEFRVNSFTTGYQDNPSVALDRKGNFVVSWNSLFQDGSSWGVFAQRYDAGGSAAGGEFRVNTYTTSYQVYPWVSRSTSGNFVVVWASYRQ